MRSSMLCLSLVFVSCGSKLDSGPTNRVQVKQYADAIPTVNTATSTSGCSLTNPPAALAAQGFRVQNISALTLTTADGRTKSLCDDLLESNSAVGIVQFAGVTCLSCQDEAKFFSAKLSSQNSANGKMVHVVAMTDLLSDYQEDDFANFFKKYAPQSLRMHDASTNMWRYFSVDPAEPSRPTIFVYNRAGWSYLVNTEGSKPDAAYAAAVTLAGQQTDASKVPTNPAVIVPTPRPVVTPVATPVPTSQPTVAPTPTPSKPQAELTSSQNAALTGGPSGETLASYFGDSNYLIIDLSQYNCGYCRDLANEHQSDSRFQAAMSSGKCKDITLVPSGEISSWQRAYPTSTFVGKASRGVSNESGVARAFGVSFPGTPTVFIIDRKGAVVDSAVGQMPSKVSSLCY